MISHVISRTTSPLNYVLTDFQNWFIQINQTGGCFMLFPFPECDDAKMVPYEDSRL